MGIQVFTSNAPTYKVFTGLLTQSGGDDEQFMNDDIYLVKGVTYDIVANDVPNFNFVPYGAPNNDNGTKFIANETITFLGIIDCSLSYNNGAPVCTVLENTLGNVWFTYDSVGNYYLNSIDLLIVNKTFTLNSQTRCNNINDQFFNLLFVSIDDSIFRIIILDDNLFTANDLLTSKMIEIRVYN